MTRVLLVDVGNTNTCLAVARNGRIGRETRLPCGIRAMSGIRQAVRGAVGARGAAASVLSSVVPEVTGAWKSVLSEMLGVEPVVVSHRAKLGVAVDYPRPSTIGADRLANACGAVAQYGAPVIVADFGTALTFDVISREGAYIGGVIAPGLPLMTDYLAQRTALLPAIRLRGQYGPVGRSTVGAMRLGAKVGYRGMVREIVTHLAESLQMQDATLCATGGFARWALEGLELPFVFDPCLTLRGMYRVYELNTRGT